MIKPLTPILAACSSQPTRYSDPRMSDTTRYFFCGVGGSGMMPLAMILRAQGFEVAGSDRALDQGRSREKFDALRAAGIALYPQDGSGLTGEDQVLVASAAVEDTVPDVQAAARVGARRQTRAELLSHLFNQASVSVGVAGTSGKSTTTAMLGWILAEAGADPTIMNGAVMPNFASPDAPFASARVGEGGVFVSEVDESDGSIALFEPTIAVLNNISLDHKSMAELRALFGDFLAKSAKAIVNLDDAESAALAASVVDDKRKVTVSLAAPDADFVAHAITPARTGVGFVVVCRETGERAQVSLAMPGRHNVSNALAAIAAAGGCGVPLEAAASALGRFAGVRRRLELVGEAAGVAVYDDFAHNPDKIAATLSTLRAFPGRLLVMWQPHGFGPLRLMKEALADAFAAQLGEDDVLVMPEPVYFGGTVERDVSSADLAALVREQGRRAEVRETREACGELLLSMARLEDRIVIMGARDDTLTTFAQGLLSDLAAR